MERNFVDATAASMVGNHIIFSFYFFVFDCEKPFDDWFFNQNKIPLPKYIDKFHLKTEKL